MIAYTTFGTNDLPRALAFYDALFEAIGIKRLADWGEQGSCWGSDWTSPMFGVLKPFDGNAASAGNGTMISIACKSPEAVQALHAKALALGGKDEGAPGPRGPKFYAGYFRDLDGNKMNGFCSI
jgi:catechol 2,3-dioxygenase-like lactoylglutathione lyase family enzyme